MLRFIFRSPFFVWIRLNENYYNSFLFIVRLFGERRLFPRSALFAALLFILVRILIECSPAASIAADSFDFITAATRQKSVIPSPIYEMGKSPSTSVGVSVRRVTRSCIRIGREATAARRQRRLSDYVNSSHSFCSIVSD